LVARMLSKSSSFSLMVRPKLYGKAHDFYLRKVVSGRVNLERLRELRKLPSCFLRGEDLVEPLLDNRCAPGVGMAHVTFELEQPRGVSGEFRVSGIKRPSHLTWGRERSWCLLAGLTFTASSSFLRLPWTSSWSRPSAPALFCASSSPKALACLLFWRSNRT
jgi:hypothetical protein